MIYKFTCHLASGKWILDSGKWILSLVLNSFVVDNAEMLSLNFFNSTTYFLSFHTMNTRDLQKK